MGDNVNKSLLIIGLIALIGAFSFGYYKGKNSIEVVASVAVVEVKDKEVDKHVETVTTKDKEGNVKIVTIVDSVSRSKDSKRSDTTTVVKSLPKLNISLLGGYDFTGKQFVYGLSLTKEVYGPLTVGVFGLSNKTAGISVGLSLP